MKKIVLLFLVLGLLFLVGCAKEKYLVIYDLNGGKLISGDAIQQVAAGENGTPPIVEYAGYELSWDNESNNITKDTIVTAVWTPKTFGVVFDLNGGNLISGELVQKVNMGEGAQAPSVSCEGKILSWDKDFSCVTEDMTISAVWNKKVMNSVEIAEHSIKRTVVIKCDEGDEESTGTGFFIDNKGTIVTNFHVIKYAESLKVELYSGATYDVKEIVSFLPVLDLAVLKIDCDNTDYFELNKEKVLVGEPVYTVGTSLGFLESSFTSGVISSNTREIGKIECYQMDAPISSGNSGGPLVNQYGEVIGVNSYSYSRGNDLHLAIKIAQLDDLEETNMTIKEYGEWLSFETGRSYSPWEIISGKYHYYFSLVNTYQHITGQTCLRSIDLENEKSRNGYYDCCEGYVYTYQKSEYEKYIEYLKSIGFEFDSETTGSSGSQIITYYSELDSIYIDFFFWDDDNEICISVYY